MTNGLKQDYSARIQQICDYICANPDDDLSLENLAQVAGFSPFHFHRQFSNYMGTTIARYILMMRLKRASYQLVFGDNGKIIDIALDAGFENPESFSRAFKKTIGQTPSQFRKNPEWELWSNRVQIPHIERRTEMNLEIKFINVEETRVAVLEHRGSADLLNASVGKFIEWRKTSRLSPVEKYRTFGLAYDDPATTPEEQFRFDICAEVKTEVPENSQSVINKVIPSGRCVVIRHIGAHEQMSEKIYEIYGKWLPESGETLRDFPCYFEYKNFFPDVPENELITDIYFPLSD